MAKERIGLIGTGIMGRPMAQNLLKAGYHLTVHNRTKAKVRQLLSAGALWAESPADMGTATLKDTKNMVALLLMIVLNRRDF